MKTQMKALASAMLVGAALSVPLGAAAAAFQNGSFETPGIGPGGQLDITSVAQAPTGWIPSGTLGNFALFYEHYNLYNLPALDGVNAIGFGGNVTTGAVLSQTFDTVASTTYTVTYFITAQQLGNGPQSYIAAAFDGATLLGSEIASIPVALNWVSHSFSFVAASASSTLSFIDTSNGAAAAGINWALDNVSVTGDVSAVPEPSVIALMSAGLAALVFVRRARRRA